MSPANETVPAAPLLEASRLLAERGGYGLVWLDRDLVTRARYGRLVDFIEVDCPVCETLLPLIGLERDIRQLDTSPGSAIELPAVAVHLPGLEIPRLNLTIMALESGQSFLVLAVRAITRANLEIELSAQMRARLIAESELKAKSQELALANRDLEDFAGIISHDLQAPLRAMRYLAEDASQALAAARHDEARAGLEDLVRRARRMSRMLSELLDYASVGRKEEVVDDVDTARLVKEVVETIARPDGVHIEIVGHWPRIETAEAALDLVLRNLITNAVTHHDREHGRVTVAASGLPSHVAISVADDGPGIDPRQHQAMFLPFRAIGATGGSGMGLAFVKRAVEAMGGTLEVHSDPARQRGTRFVIKVPKRLQRGRSSAR